MEKKVEQKNKNSGSKVIYSFKPKMKGEVVYVYTSKQKRDRDDS